MVLIIRAATASTRVVAVTMADITLSHPCIIIIITMVVITVGLATATIATILTLAREVSLRDDSQAMAIRVMPLFILFLT
jgi:hypothetical protein